MRGLEGGRGSMRGGRQMTDVCVCVCVCAHEVGVCGLDGAVDYAATATRTCTGGFAK